MGFTEDFLNSWQNINPESFNSGGEAQPFIPDFLKGSPVTQDNEQKNNQLQMSQEEWDRLSPWEKADKEKEQREAKYTKSVNDLGPVEKFGVDISNVGKSLSGLFGLNEWLANAAEDNAQKKDAIGQAAAGAGNLVGGLVGGILGMPLTGVGKIIQGTTGTPVTESNFEGTNIADYKLNDAEKGGALLSGAVDEIMSLPIFKVGGTVAKGLGKLGLEGAAEGAEAGLKAMGNVFERSTEDGIIKSAAKEAGKMAAFGVPMGFGEGMMGNQETHEQDPTGEHAFERGLQAIPESVASGAGMGALIGGARGGIAKVGKAIGNFIDKRRALGQSDVINTDPDVSIDSDTPRPIDPKSVNQIGKGIFREDGSYTVATDTNESFEEKRKKTERDNSTNNGPQQADPTLNPGENADGLENWSNHLINDPTSMDHVFDFIGQEVRDREGKIIKNGEAWDNEKRQKAKHILVNKYVDGSPEDSISKGDGYDWLETEVNSKLDALASIGKYLEAVYAKQPPTSHDPHKVIVRRVHARQRGSHLVSSEEALTSGADFDADTNTLSYNPEKIAAAVHLIDSWVNKQDGKASVKLDDMKIGDAVVDHNKYHKTETEHKTKDEIVETAVDKAARISGQISKEQKDNYTERIKKAYDKRGDNFGESSADDSAVFNTLIEIKNERVELYKQAGFNEWQAELAANQDVYSIIYALRNEAADIRWDDYTPEEKAIHEQINKNIDEAVVPERVQLEEIDAGFGVNYDFGKIVQRLFDFFILDKKEKDATYRINNPIKYFFKDEKYLDSLTESQTALLSHLILANDMSRNVNVGGKITASKKMIYELAAERAKAKLFKTGVLKRESDSNIEYINCETNNINNLIIYLDALHEEILKLKDPYNTVIEKTQLSTGEVEVPWYDKPKTIRQKKLSGKVFVEENGRPTDKINKDVLNELITDIYDVIENGNIDKEIQFAHGERGSLKNICASFYDGAVVDAGLYPPQMYNIIKQYNTVKRNTFKNNAIKMRDAIHEFAVAIKSINQRMSTVSDLRNLFKEIVRQERGKETIELLRKDNSKVFLYMRNWVGEDCFLYNGIETVDQLVTHPCFANVLKAPLKNIEKEVYKSMIALRTRYNFASEIELMILLRRAIDRKRYGAVDYLFKRITNQLNQKADIAVGDPYYRNIAEKWNRMCGFNVREWNFGEDKIQLQNLANACAMFRDMAFSDRIPKDLETILHDTYILEGDTSPVAKDMSIDEKVLHMMLDPGESVSDYGMAATYHRSRRIIKGEQNIELNNRESCISRNRNFDEWVIENKKEKAVMSLTVQYLRSKIADISPELQLMAALEGDGFFSRDPEKVQCTEGTKAYASALQMRTLQDNALTRNVVRNTLKLNDVLPFDYVVRNYNMLMAKIIVDPTFKFFYRPKNGGPQKLMSLDILYEEKTGTARRNPGTALTFKEWSELRKADPKLGNVYEADSLSYNSTPGAPALKVGSSTENKPYQDILTNFENEKNPLYREAGNNHMVKKVLKHLVAIGDMTGSLDPLFMTTVNRQRSLTRMQAAGEMRKNITRFNKFKDQIALAVLYDVRTGTWGTKDSKYNKLIDSLLERRTNELIIAAQNSILGRQNKIIGDDALIAISNEISKGKEDAVTELVTQFLKRYFNVDIEGNPNVLEKLTNDAINEIILNARDRVNEIKRQLIFKRLKGVIQDNLLESTNEEIGLLNKYLVAWENGLKAMRQNLENQRANAGTDKDILNNIDKHQNLIDRIETELKEFSQYSKDPDEYIKQNILESVDLDGFTFGLVPNDIGIFSKQFLSLSQDELIKKLNSITNNVAATVTGIAETLDKQGDSTLKEALDFNSNMDSLTRAVVIPKIINRFMAEEYINHSFSETLRGRIKLDGTKIVKDKLDNYANAIKDYIDKAEKENSIRPEGLIPFTEEELEQAVTNIAWSDDSFATDYSDIITDIFTKENLDNVDKAWGKLINAPNVNSVSLQGSMLPKAAPAVAVLKDIVEPIDPYEIKTEDVSASDIIGDLLLNICKPINDFDVDHGSNYDHLKEILKIAIPPILRTNISANRKADMLMDEIGGLINLDKRIFATDWMVDNGIMSQDNKSTKPSETMVKQILVNIINRTNPENGIVEGLPDKSIIVDDSFEFMGWNEQDTRGNEMENRAITEKKSRPTGKTLNIANEDIYDVDNTKTISKSTLDTFKQNWNWKTLASECLTMAHDHQREYQLELLNFLRNEDGVESKADNGFYTTMAQIGNKNNIKCLNIRTLNNVSPWFFITFKDRDGALRFVKIGKRRMRELAEYEGEERQQLIVDGEEISPDQIVNITHEILAQDEVYDTLNNAGRKVAANDGSEADVRAAMKKEYLDPDLVSSPVESFDEVSNNVSYTAPKFYKPTSYIDINMTLYDAINTRITQNATHYYNLNNKAEGSNAIRPKEIFKNEIENTYSTNLQEMVANSFFINRYNIADVLTGKAQIPQVIEVDGYVKDLPREIITEINNTKKVFESVFREKAKNRVEGRNNEDYYKWMPMIYIDAGANIPLQKALNKIELAVACSSDFICDEKTASKISRALRKNGITWDVIEEENLVNPIDNGRMYRFKINNIRNWESRDLSKFGAIKNKSYRDSSGSLGNITFAAVSNDEFTTADGMVQMNRKWASTQNVHWSNDEELDLSKLGPLSNIKIVTKSDELESLGNRLYNGDESLVFNTKVYSELEGYDNRNLLDKTIEFLKYPELHTYDSVSNDNFCSMQGANMVSKDFVGVALATSKTGNKQYLIPLILKNSAAIEKTDSVFASINDTTGNKPNKIVITQYGDHRLGTTSDRDETIKTYGNNTKGMGHFTDKEFYLNNGCIVPIGVSRDNMKSNNDIGTAPDDIWNISSQLVPVLSFAVKDKGVYKTFSDNLNASGNYTPDQAAFDFITFIWEQAKTNPKFRKTPLGSFLNHSEYQEILREITHPKKYFTPGDGNLEDRYSNFWVLLSQQDMKDLAKIDGYEAFADQGLATFLSKLISLTAHETRDPRLYLNSQFMIHNVPQYLSEYLTTYRNAAPSDAEMYTGKLYRTLMPKGEEIYDDMMYKDGYFKLLDKDGNSTHNMKVILRQQVEGDPYSAYYYIKPDGTIDTYEDGVSLMKGGKGSVKKMLIGLSMKNGDTSPRVYKAYRKYIGLDQKIDKYSKFDYDYIDHDPERDIPFTVIHNKWAIDNISNTLVKKFEEYRKGFRDKIEVFVPKTDKTSEGKKIENLLSDEYPDVRNNLLRLMNIINRRIEANHPESVFTEDDPRLLNLALRFVNDKYGNFRTSIEGTDISETRAIPIRDFIEYTQKCIEDLEEGKIPGYSDDIFSRTQNSLGKPKGEQRVSVTIADLSRLKQLCQLGIIDESFLDARTKCLERIRNTIQQLAEDTGNWSYDSKSIRTQAIKNYLYFSKYALGEEISRDWLAHRMTWDDIKRIEQKTHQQFSDFIPEDRETWAKMNAERDRDMQMQERFVVNDNQEPLTGDAVVDDAIRVRKNKQKSKVLKGLNNAADIAQASGFGILTGAQNVVSRGYNFYKNHALLMFGKKGAFGTLNPFNHKPISGASKWFKDRMISDPKVQELKTALDIATYLGREEEFLYKIRTEETTPEAFLKELTAKHGKGVIENIANRYKGWATRIFGGEWSFKKKSVEVWYEMWMMEAWKDPVIRKFLETPVDEAGNTRWKVMETKYADDPVKLAIEMMASSEDLPFDKMQRRVLNNSREGDYAHNNAPMVMYEELCRIYPGVKPITILLATRFLRAQTNVFGSRLGWFLPMRTFNKIACHAMSSEKFKTLLEHGPGKIGKEFRDNDMAWEHWLNELEAASGYSGWKANILCDLMKVTLPNVAMALAASIALQPPSEDDHWSNYKEWTFCGIKLEHAWWIDDLIGFALPAAAFWKSVELGKPRFDIISKGYAEVAANNPVFKCGKALEGLFDPDLEVDKYKIIEETYKNNPGQVPTKDVVDAWNGTELGLTVLGNIIDPAWVKEIVNFTNPDDVDYKRIAKNFQSKGIGGHRPGDNEELVRTTYEDAVIRKVTRNNPVLALFFDYFGGENTTGYGKWEQASKYNYDPNQQDFLHTFTILDYENNTIKPENECRAVAAKVLDMLNSTDDMSALYHKGFLLDEPTKKYIGSMLEQSYEDIKNQYNKAVNSGQLNFYVLGEGDYQLGQQKYNEYVTEYVAALKNIQSIYLDKLMSDELNQGWQKYRVPTTTWYTDDNGKPYRSGHQQNLSALIHPISTITAGPSNAGPEGSYAQLSAVTNQPMYDMNGNPIRNVVAVQPTKNVGTKAKWATETISPKQPSSAYAGYNSKSGSGNRYSSGRSGGGGGGRSTIYSHAPNLNIGNAATPRATKTRKANYDYLRPNFEVAGSADAYKRDTI